MHYKTRLHLTELALLAFCIVLITGTGLAVASGVANAQDAGNESDADTTNSSNQENSENASDEDPPTVLHSIDHVTIHDIDWREDSVAIDLTAERSDIVSITDYADDRFYWEDYDIEPGRQTIVHEYRGESGFVSFAVESAGEGKELKSNTRFVLPGANEVATLLMGVVLSFVLVAALKLRRDRKREKGSKRVF